MLPEQIQKSNSSPRSLGISQGNTQFDSKLSNNDLDCPIALRKGVRSCTNHPIYNFVSYEGLSPSFRVFVTSLNKIQIPNTIHEAIKVLSWKKLMLWRKIKLGKLQTYYQENIQRDANGFSLLNTKQVGVLTASKLGWLQKGSLSPMGSTIRKHLPNSKTQYNSSTFILGC